MAESQGKRSSRRVRGVFDLVGLEEGQQRPEFRLEAVSPAGERKAVGFVLGLPINMDGSEGPRAQTTRAFARNLARLTELPIALWDERLSTAAVERALIEADASRAKRRSVIDQHAAAYILQGALDRLWRERSNEPYT